MILNDGMEIAAKEVRYVLDAGFPGFYDPKLKAVNALEARVEHEVKTPTPL